MSNFFKKLFTKGTSFAASFAIPPSFKGDIKLLEKTRFIASNPKLAEAYSSVLSELLPCGAEFGDTLGKLAKRIGLETGDIIANSTAMGALQDLHEDLDEFFKLRDKYWEIIRRYNAIEKEVSFQMENQPTQPTEV